MLEELGQQMRARREARGLTLHDVQAELKIRSRYLEAIEAGDYGVFPGEVYARGFLRSYARFLGMDEQQVMAAYREAQPVPAPAAPAGQGASFRRLTLTQADEEGAGHARERPAPAHRAGGGSGLSAWIFGGLGVAAVAVAVLYAIGAGRMRPPVGPAGVPPASAPTAAVGDKGALAGAGPAPVRSGAPPAPARPQEAQFRRLPAPADRPDVHAYEVTLPPGADAIAVEVTSGARCWYSVVADGREVAQGFLEADQSGAWRAAGEISIRLGYPAGVRWSVNGKAGEMIQEVNPITLQLTRKR